MRNTTHARVSGGLASLALLGLLASTAACGAADAVDNASDCNTICDRYRSCFDTNYNVQGCYDRCTANGSNDAEQRRRIDTCDACINGLSCTSAAFTCASECSSIVP
ncbi:MAG: hypothetical protein R3A52_28990 [Polyangiales bacterium]